MAIDSVEHDFIIPDENLMYTLGFIKGVINDNKYWIFFDDERFAFPEGKHIHLSDVLIGCKNRWIGVGYRNAFAKLRTLIGAREA